MQLVPVVFTFAGYVDSFDTTLQVAFKEVLLERFPLATDVLITVQSASIRVTATLVLATRTDADDAIKKLRTTSEVEFQKEWFDPLLVTLEGPPTVGNVYSIPLAIGAVGTAGTTAGEDANALNSAQTAAEDAARASIIAGVLGGIIGLFFICALAALAYARHQRRKGAGYVREVIPKPELDASSEGQENTDSVEGREPSERSRGGANSTSRAAAAGGSLEFELEVIELAGASSQPRADERHGEGATLLATPTTHDDDEFVTIFDDVTTRAPASSSQPNDADVSELASPGSLDEQRAAELEERQLARMAVARSVRQLLALAGSELAGAPDTSDLSAPGSPSSLRTLEAEQTEMELEQEQLSRMAVQRSAKLRV